MPAAIDNSIAFYAKAVAQATEESLVFKSEKQNIGIGGAFSFVVNKKGIAHSFGSNFHGQLGNGTKVASNIQVKLANGGGFKNDGSDPVVAVVAGYGHSILLTQNGLVYSFGSNRQGELGNGDGGYSFHRPKDKPVKVKDGGGFKNNGSDPVVAVAAGLRYTVLLTQNGLLYSFGSNDYSSLGNGTGEIRSRLPAKIANGDGFKNDGSDPVVLMSSDRNSSSFVTQSGLVYSFGYNFRGQLGNGGTNSSSRIPVKLADGGGFKNDGSDPVVAVQTGFSHSLLLTQSGLAYTFGSNANGQLGNGTNADSNIPVNINHGFSLTGTALLHSKEFVTRYTSNVRIGDVSEGNVLQLKKNGGSYQTIALNAQGEYTIGTASPFVVNEGEKAEFTILSLDDEYTFIIDKRTPFVTKWTPGGENITIPTTGSGYNYDIAICAKDTTLLSAARSTASHTSTEAAVSSSDTVLVFIYGDFPQIYFNNTNASKDKIISVEQWGGVAWRSMVSAFDGCGNLTNVPGAIAKDAPNLSTENISLSAMFKRCGKLNCDLSGWNLSRVNGMDFMFDQSGFNNAGKALTWTTEDGGRVMSGSLTGMFRLCPFNQNISSWNTSEITKLNKMFEENSAFNQNLSTWQVGNIANFSSMFEGALLFNDGR